MSEWIKLEDHYPEEGIKVMVYSSSSNQYFLDYTIYMDYGIIWACSKEEDYMQFTHWMPLPEAPK